MERSLPGRAVPYRWIIAIVLFLRLIDRKTPKHLQLHLIVDN
jgi:hypothetical protein